MPSLEDLVALEPISLSKPNELYRCVLTHKILRYCCNVVNKKMHKPATGVRLQFRHSRTIFTCAPARRVQRTPYSGRSRNLRTPACSAQWSRRKYQLC